MSLLDRALTYAESSLGISVRPANQIAALEERSYQFEQFTLEASELAHHALNYAGGRPQDLLPERRARLAQRSRIAFIQDPLAGAEAMHLANFSLGRGISKPDADSEEAQQAIDDAWTDTNNEEMFTGFAAQRRSSNSLLTQGELFDTLYRSGGSVRVGKLIPDDVIDIVTDPENGMRPIYYLALRRKTKWDVENDRPDPTYEQTDDGKPKITYYPHWRNLDDAERERQQDPTLEPLPNVPAEKLPPGDAVVFHTAINQVDGQLRGNPPWARSLRFYSAMNTFTEARVTMAQAAATFVAKRVLSGGAGPDDVVRQASSVLAQTGELAAASFEAAYGQTPGPRDPYTQQLPPPPGSWFVENEQHKLESLSLNSGAAQAVQDVQIIRAPVAAAAMFGQHYLGDASNANLATATSLELPTLMHVQSWQETLEQRKRWFTDRVLEEAAKGGRLGRPMSAEEDPEDNRQLSELVLQEADNRRTFERRLNMRLTYSFEMPYPGRRNLPDVTSAFTEVLGVGNGALVENEPMMENMLMFFFKDGLQRDNAPDLVKKIMDAYKKHLADKAKREEEMARMAGQLPAGGPGSSTQEPGTPTASPGESPPGATPPKNDMGNTPMGEREWIPADLRSRLAQHDGEAADIFSALVMDPARIAALSLSANGNGASGSANGS